MNRDRLKTYVPLIIAITLVLGVALGNVFTRMRLRTYIAKEITRQNNIRSDQFLSNGFSLGPKKDKISSTLDYISDHYVDTVPLKKITEDAIPEILQHLDPHSNYIPAKDFSKYNEPLEGGFSGIGVLFNMNEDTVAIINCVPNGPSELVGILPGDRIVMVEEDTVAGVRMDSDDIVAKLKGKKGSTVRIKVKRRGHKELLDFEIVRDDIPLYSVDVHYMINDEIGYVKVNSFAQTTYGEFLEAVQDLKEQGMKKIIIDLRTNGGGIMEAAIGLADQFLEEDKLIVYTEGRSRPRKNEYSTARGILKKDDVAILIDEFSASASEILAGAIQDNDRGIIIGRRSFGKGLVQEQMNFPDGSAIRLTVAKYYTPTGRSIQKPYTEDREEYYHDISYRYLNGEFESADSINFSDSLKYVTPKGKTVYGGGGIMPDVFVPADTNYYSDYLQRAVNRGLIHRYAFSYTDQHRNDLMQFENLDDILNYINDQELKEGFIKFAESKGLKTDYEQFAISEVRIMNQLKAYIARNTIDNIGFYPVIHQLDQTLKVAVDTLAAL